MLKPLLEYPLEQVPGAGKILSVRPGIGWLRLPLPMALDHINLYLLDDANGWDLVDTGLHTAASKAHWEALFDGQLDPEKLRRIIVTHMHPDHVGLAGWLQQWTGADLYMSRTDYYICRVLTADPPGKPPDTALRFYHRAGFSDDLLAQYEQRFGTFGAMVSAMPQSYRRLQAGQVLHSGSRDWRLVEGQGHAPEHICLYCEEDDIFIAGDQLLPAISSNVSVWPTEPDADPLADWLDSCHRLSQVITNQTLVLPSHGKPFRGGVSRLEWLLQHHADQLEQTRIACTRPATAKDVIAALFQRRLSGADMVMAAGEAIAHLNYLLHRGELTVERSGAADRYVRT